MSTEQETRLRQALNSLAVDEQQFRVVETANPYVSPFPDLTWPTRELAEKFCNSKEAGEWRGKLTAIAAGARESPFQG